jgi:hypothetical protein
VLIKSLISEDALGAQGCQVQLKSSADKMHTYLLPLQFSNESMNVYRKSENVGKTLFIINDATQVLKANHHLASDESVQLLFNLAVFSGQSIDVIQNYFSNFEQLNMNSHIYGLTELGNKILLSEVYKTHPNADMTISKLCSLTNDLNKTEGINRDSIWKRRKNLTGLKLKVGFIEGSMLVTSSPGVIISQKYKYCLCV